MTADVSYLCNGVLSHFMAVSLSLSVQDNNEYNGVTHNGIFDLYRRPWFRFVDHSVST